MLLQRRFEERAAEAYALGKIGGFCHLYIGQEAVSAGTPVRAPPRRLRHHHLPRPRPGPRPRHHPARRDGRAVRPRRRLRARQGRLDAHVRPQRRTSSAATASSAATSRSPPASASPSSTAAATRCCVCFLGEAAVNSGAFHEALNMAGALEAARDLHHREQPVRHGHRHRARARRSRTSYKRGAVVRHGRRAASTGRTCSRCATRWPRPSSAPAPSRRADAPRGAHLPLPGPLDVRRRQRHLPHQGRARGIREARSDRAVPQAHAGRRRTDRRRVRRAGHRAQGASSRTPGTSPTPAPNRPSKPCTRTCSSRPPLAPRRRPDPMPVITYRDALNQALREEMQRDDRVFLMGEEVGVYNGAYKVSKGLLEEFGEMRVVDTPITELGFAGARRRRRHGRPAPDHRVHDLELRPARLRPGRQHRRQDALHVGRPVQRADRLPRPQRRRPAARRAALAGLGVVARPRPRPQGRHARHAGRRQGPPQERHPRRQPGVLPRGRDALQHQGRSARRRVPRPDRQGRRQARGRRTAPIITQRQDGARRPAGRRPARQGRHQRRRRRPAHRAPHGRRRRSSRIGQEDQPRRGARRRAGKSPASAPRSWTTSSATASTTSTRPSSACTRPTCPCRTPRTSRRQPSPTRPRPSPPSATSCTSTEGPRPATRCSHGYESLHGGALSHDGGRTPRQMAQERRRRRQDRRHAGRSRDRQGDHGTRRPRRRRAPQAPRQRGRRRARGRPRGRHRRARREHRRASWRGASTASRPRQRRTAAPARAPAPASTTQPARARACPGRRSPNVHG